MIKGVCFDLDGVFFTKKGMLSVKNELIQLSGNEKAVIEVLFTSDIMKSLKKGELTSEEYLSFLNEKLGTQFTQQSFSELIARDYEIDLEVFGFMNHLKGRSVKILACSNNFSLRIDALEARFSFLQYFDTAVFSYQVHALKPMSDIYRELINTSGLQGHEIAYTDDSAEGLVRASSLGIKTHEFKSFAEYRDWLLATEPALA